MKSYDHKIIEAKWSKVWDKQKAFKVDIKNAKNPFYNLAMFPYPSAEGLHMGHIIPYSGVDTYGRYLRMKGLDVFEPMGFDAFGIHSENFALKKSIHPKKLISQTVKYFREKQMKRLGTLFDWDREVNTTDPNYYKWTQWLFTKMFKAGLAEKRKAAVTYCPSCKTVLSDEQTEQKEGVTVCERCKTPIERKELEQWFFKITKYADRLLSNLNHLSPDAYGKKSVVPKQEQEKGINWSEKTKNSQRNWIGKSEGINITYKVTNSTETIMCFTTTPVNFGATFIVLAPEHPFVNYLLSSRVSHSEARLSLEKCLEKSATSSEISNYVKKATSKSEIERIAEGKEKTGVFTGFYAINHVTGKEIPIWISDFVIGTVGTGAVQGCPGHDKRDFVFAKKFGIPIPRVVTGPNGETGPIEKEEDVVEEGGVMVNSEFLNGIPFKKAMQMTMDYFEQKGWGKRVVHYKLRDWCISRQRYWGPPIPMIYCKKCQWQPVSEKDLPVLLPFIKDYKPTGDGKSPLARDKNWLKVKCPHCGGWAERETDVSDTFLDSAWYFLRYPSVGLPTSGQGPFDPTVTRKWLPVDMYIGGHEHAVLHLMYSRFVTMALKDMGYIDFEEPFKRFFAHGLLISEGAKMSKSRGNVVNPNIYLDKYGADTLRLYILFLGPYDAGGDFRDKGITGMHKFLKRVWNLVNCTPNLPNFPNNPNWEKKLKITQNKTIKKVSEDIANLHFNTAIASLMEFYNVLSDFASSPNSPKTPNTSNKTWNDAIKTLLLLLAPFAPFITEELYQSLINADNNAEKHKTSVNQRRYPHESAINSIHSQPWPKFDPSLLEEEEVTIVVQVNGKVREKLTVSGEQKTNKEEVTRLALASNKVQRFFSNTPNLPNHPKVIFVPGKLINFVV